MKALLFSILLMANTVMAGESGVWLKSNDEDSVVARLPRFNYGDFC